MGNAAFNALSLEPTVQIIFKFGSNPEKKNATDEA
jgi:hypothetical protein